LHVACCTLSVVRCICRQRRSGSAKSTSPSPGADVQGASPAPVPVQMWHRPVPVQMWAGADYFRTRDECPRSPAGLRTDWQESHEKQTHRFQVWVGFPTSAVFWSSSALSRYSAMLRLPRVLCRTRRCWRGAVPVPRWSSAQNMCRYLPVRATCEDSTHVLSGAVLRQYCSAALQRAVLHCAGTRCVRDSEVRTRCAVRAIGRRSLAGLAVATIGSLQHSTRYCNAAHHAMLQAAALPSQPLEHCATTACTRVTLQSLRRAGRRNRE